MAEGRKRLLPLIDQNGQTIDRTAKINPMDIFDEDANKIKLDREGFLDKAKRTAAYRASLNDPKESFGASAPQKKAPMLQTLPKEPAMMSGHAKANASTEDIPKAKPMKQNARKPDGLSSMKDKVNNLGGLGSLSGFGNLEGLGSAGGGAAEPLSSKTDIKPRKFIDKERGKELGLGWQGRMKANSDQESTYRALGSQDLQNKGSVATQGLRNVGSTDVQSLRNQGAASVQGLQNKGSAALQGLRNKGAADIAEKNNEGTQKNLKIKNAQAIKERNAKRLKDRHDLYQAQLNSTAVSRTPEEYATLQSNAAKATTDYERSLGSGTTGKSNNLLQEALR